MRELQEFQVLFNNALEVQLVDLYASISFSGHVKPTL
jgi:hypothetical protein